MSKDLEKEYLADLDHYDEGMGIHSTSYEKCKERLIRLASIDNANPSEALRNLEYLKSHISARDMLGETNKKIALDICNDVKQALLKQQELPEPFKTGVDIGVIKPKHYLKWDDIEFRYETKTQKVRIGDTTYKIAYVCSDNTKEVQILSEDEKLLYFNFVGKYKDNVQLFNDLHLEVVDNE